MSQSKFKIGDVLTGKKNLEIVPYQKMLVGLNNGKSAKYKTYTIQGVHGKKAFAHNLMQQRFLLVKGNSNPAPFGYDLPNGVHIILIDDFKPNLYGYGYKLEATTLDIFVKTGEKVIDISKYPISAQKIIVQKEIDDYFNNGYTTKYGKDLEHKLLFVKKHYSKIFSDDLYKIFCILNTIGVSCHNCNHPLQKPETETIDYGDVEFNVVKKEIAYKLGSRDLLHPSYEHFIVFPVLFVCFECKTIHALFSTHPKECRFDSISIGHRDNWL